MGEKSMVPYVKILEGFRHMIVENYSKLGDISGAIQGLGGKVVVTIGTWDLFHIGHARYLRKASEYGNVLIAGVDTDRAVKLYKDPSRPKIPYIERAEVLTHLTCVDFVTPIDDVEMIRKNPVWQYGLLKAVRPDIFIAVSGSYPDPQIEDIRRYCGHIVILPRQAETSTSEIIRRKAIHSSSSKNNTGKNKRRKK